MQNVAQRSFYYEQRKMDFNSCIRVGCNGSEGTTGSRQVISTHAFDEMQQFAHLKGKFIMQFQLIHPTWMQRVVLIFMGCSLLFQLMHLGSIQQSFAFNIAVGHMISTHAVT